MGRCMKTALLKGLVGISLLLGLVSCAMGPRPDVSSRLELLAEDVKPPRGTSLIYVIRPSIGYPDCNMEIRLDDIPAGMLPPGSYSIILSDPGERRLRVGGEECGVDQTGEFNLKADKVHYVYVNYVWMGSYLFLPEVSEERGKELLNECLLAPNETSKLLFPDYKQEYK